MVGEHLFCLKTILVFFPSRFINYGSGSKRFPLQDVLLYALEFARTKPDHSSKQPLVSQDVEMTSPSPTAR